jgi:glycosyltransferase involved in cell wall biosynthesis
MTRLRLDLLSPLPPVKSGISDYTVDLLPELAARADVRVVALPDQEVAPDVTARWRPVTFAEAGYADGGPGPGDRLPLYQMGNNRYHVAVEQAAMAHPGVLVLHDLVLHHQLLAMTVGRDDHPPYLARMAADHGWLGTAVAESRYWGGWAEASQFALPAHRTLLRRQRGVLVHSQWAADEIADADPTIAVRAVPMGIPLPPPPDPAAGAAFRARHGIPADVLLLGSFGFQTPIKRPEVAIAALASPALAGVHLLIAGDVAAVLDLDDLARRAGVRARVHITGYLPFAELEAAIAAADLALNLRYPTAGETSASLLRVLALGRPAVVSDYAQFAELPSAIACRVPVGDDEVAALTAALVTLAADPVRRRAMGEAARAHVAREHAPARAAAAVVAACEDWHDRQPPGDAPAEVPAASSLVWSELPLSLAVRGAESPWPAGTARELAIEVVNTGIARWLAGRRGAGGVAVEVALLTADSDLLADRPWLDLPRDLAPGERHVFTTHVRRPPGPARLRVTPHVLGRASFDALSPIVTATSARPVWESAL